MKTLEEKKEIIIRLLNRISDDEIQKKRNCSANYKEELTGNSTYSFITPSCDGFCYIGQGGVALDNSTFSRNVLEEITDIPEKSSKLWEILFNGNDAKLTREEQNKENPDKPKKKNLPQLCHRIMIFCYPNEFLDISRLDDLKIIANWLNESLNKKDKEFINTKGANWYDLNRSVYKKIHDLIRDNANLNDDIEYRICQVGWTLKNYINMNIDELLLKNKNLILTGAPGTGKSFMAKEIAISFTGDIDPKDHPHYKMVQFHPSYDYTDFVEGMRPSKKDGISDITFEYKQGVFREFCENAAKDETDQNYVFIIDEINRGEVNKIFGELFYCIDPDKRGTAGQITTQYDNINDNKGPFANGFYVPENVYIIGTMNDIDRSIESIDFAFRRRFLWKEIKWDESFDRIVEDVVFNGKVTQEKLKESFTSLNNKISKELGDAYCIGGSYAQKIDKFLDEEKPLESLWNYYISNIVNEYIRGDESKNIDDYKKAFLKK